ncbi:uncharacterized protein synpo2a isoform X2 [Paramormyrops kingsleyae]|uniref:uncharacterized protein synpo2a isoform X2 n=1 Tax=Paramormyrops kingsleyae TaxID=1676925 RepID=UPI000CD5E465|nr:synaptopodin-2-like isoform X2 [Paramormyrops kingsleyae]
MRSGSMRTGDYLCLSLSGGAPWGFSLQKTDGEHPQLIKVTQVEQGCPAALGGLCVGDELVSLNDQPCADLTLLEITALADGSTSSLRLLVKRCGANGQPAPDPKPDYFGERDTGTKGLESTTLEIWPARQQHPPRELYICESQDEAYYGEAESDAETPGQASWDRVHQLDPFTPGSVVELQLSLSDHSLDEGGTLTPPSRHSSSQVEVIHTSTTSQAIRVPGTGPGSGSLGQVEVTLQWPHKGSQGEGTVSEGSEPESSGRAEEDGGAQEAPPTAEPLGSSSEEFDSEAEKDGGKPNKHQARHARFRRSESQSEKQVKEAKSKCRRIALLLTAAPSSNNKGVLMFKKHRQRAKKFTLVSYGTGEDAPEDTDEDEDQEGKEHTVEFNFFATSESELDEELFTETQGRGRIVTFDWDTGLLEIEKKLENPQDMDRLPETKGKGALMFAQRRQRMDEITAEHEEMRRKGIPVEGVQEVQDVNVVKLGPYQTEEQSYMQSVESQVYMDVNLQQHHQQQQQQYQQPHYEQPQQYQDQQQYQQQQHYHDQQQHQQQQQHYQDLQQYQQQQYSQQQQYQQQQYQQIQQYSQSMNGMALHQATDMQKSTIITNKTAKPFSGVANKVATPFLPSSSASSQQQTVYSENQYSTVQTQGWSSVGSSEQIASRDERIAVPAIKTGILQDCRKKDTSKPMFTFKEAPKMSPNPMLLNLLNKNESKAGFQSCPEEDYLSLGAEACNFLQGPRVKQKVPPPVAPKPAINPASPPWSPPPASGDQVPSHLAENEVTTPASATAAVSLLPPGSAPAPVAAPAPMPEVPLSSQPHAAVSAWSPLESQRQPEQPDVPQDKEQPHQPESALASTFGSQSQPGPQPPLSTWSPAQTQSQAPVSTWASAPTQVEPQPPVSSWTPTQAQAQQPVKAWTPAQTHSQAQPQPPVSAWTPAHAQAPQQPPRSSPVQLHTQQKPPTHISSWPGVQQQPNLQSTDSAWTQDPAQAQAQPSWASPGQPQLQEQSKAQCYVSSWPPAQTQAQTQPPWSFAAQPQTQAQTQPQSLVSSWPPPPTSPPWPSPPQPQAQQQPSMSIWAPEPPQTHPEPPMNAWAPAPSQLQPSWTSLPQTQAPPQTPVSTLTSSHSHGQPQPPVSAWGPAQAQGPPQPPWASQPSMNSWSPQPLAPVSTMAMNQGPSASHQPVKSWNQPQSGTSSLGHPPPRRTNSYTPSTPPGIASIAGGVGSAFEMPALRGKGAELFAKRQSRMEKFVVDSSTVQTNKELDKSYSLSLPRKLHSSSASSEHALSSGFQPPEIKVPWWGKGHKPPTPWEAASRHPLGLVDEAFSFQSFQRDLASGICSAAHRKSLPEPPAEWKARVSYEPRRAGGEGAGGCRFMPTCVASPTRSVASAPAAPVPYVSPWRWQAQRSSTESEINHTVPSPGHRGGISQPGYTSTYTMPWRR